MQIMNFTIGDIQYGVPVEQVREILSTQTIIPIPGNASYVLGVSNLRGQIITVIDLKALLNLSGEVGDVRKIIWVQHDRFMVGIVVDQVTEVTTIPDTDIELVDGSSGRSQYVIGIGKQHERLTVLLDFHKIILDNSGHLLSSQDVDPVMEPIPAQL